MPAGHVATRSERERERERPNAMWAITASARRTRRRMACVGEMDENPPSFALGCRADEKALGMRGPLLFFCSLHKPRRALKRVAVAATASDSSELIES